MARMRRHKRRRPSVTGKTTQQTQQAPLAAMSVLVKAKGIFQPIHDNVVIQQKTVTYRPTDKLVQLTLGIMAGAQAVQDIQYRLRPEQALLKAYGYEACADQSVIQSTLDASNGENVQQFQGVLEQLYRQHNQSQHLVRDAFQQGNQITMDLDLTGLPCSKHFECATKGYFSKRRGIYGRQLARVLVADTQEIVTERLYPGNTHSREVLKAMLTQMEEALPLETKAQRQCIRLRLDGGFGTDANINYALWRGYELLAKLFSGNRAKVLAKSVTEWVDVADGKDAPRQAGWVTKPRRYMRTTRQLAIRKRKTKGKNKGGYSYIILILTDRNQRMAEVLADYDARSGVPESSFCQDNQGLALRKRRKSKFEAQQMLILVSQLAHNLILWFKHWMVAALEAEARMQAAMDEMLSDAMFSSDRSVGKSASTILIQQAIQSIQQRGIKRFIQQVLALKGSLRIKKGVLTCLTLEASYPLIERIALALEAVLTPYGVEVCLGRT